MEAARDRAPRNTIGFQIALALAGLVLLVAIVRHVGVDLILATLRPALRWLPVLCGLELVRMACETLSSWLAYGSLAARIPRATLFRAHVISQSLSSLAPAPRVVNEAIKIGLVHRRRDTFKHLTV
jgi:hypothetical protein